MKKNIFKFLPIIALAILFFANIAFASYPLEIILPIGSKTAKINGKTISLDVPAQIINGRTMVPLRFIADAFSSEIQWDQANKIVYIRQNKENPNLLTKRISNFSLRPNSESETATYDSTIQISKKYVRIKFSYIFRSDQSNLECIISTSAGSSKKETVQGKAGDSGTKEIIVDGNKSESMFLSFYLLSIEILDAEIDESDFPDFPEN